jgi:ubiquinol-cytochrome c reductase cytochrome c1 subunit
MAQRIAAALVGTTAATGAALTMALNYDLLADDHGIKPTKYPWFHTGLFNTLDHASVRRGYEVYKQVCAACHSMNHTCFRHLVGVSHNEEEVKALALEANYIDGPADDGSMFERPGKLSDPFPAPYKNDEEAKTANNGALPPDLSLMALARNGREDYIYSLLTGYVDVPKGMEEKEGLHYNPYFPGGWIGMAKALYEDIIEYEDGTPASTSQLAKDVSNFLKWSAEKSHDEKKKLLLKVCLVFPPVIVIFYVLKKRVFSVLKSTKRIYTAKK